MLYRYLSVSVALAFSLSASAQRFLSEYDSTLFLKDTMPAVVRRLENLHFSGYIQPQFQIAQQEGANTYSGGNFQEFSRSRFMLRRARIKLDYILPSNTAGKLPYALFTFQIDGTERGVFVRDMFMKLFEPQKNQFSLTMGLFARPFGYEVNLSSAFRETPERGRMSQILMPTERDLGAMVSWDPQPTNGKSLFRFDAGVFNGQGLVSTAEFDNYKDVIARVTLKRLNLSRSVFVTGGVSYLNGGLRQQTQYRYETQQVNDQSRFVVDSAIANVGSEAPKNYYGADAQLILKSRWGKTELRGEYWFGRQSGTALFTGNQPSLPNTPTYIRNFDGAFLYFLQNIFNDRWELMLKYDWYDPNTDVEGLEIGKTGGNFTPADIKFSTFGGGITHYLNSNLKVLAYYSFVKNEITGLQEYNYDLKDNVFTCRFQFRF